MKITSIAVAAALAATLAAPCALADESASTMDSMRVVRDKETGKLRAPSHDELKAMLAAEKAARKARGEPETAAEAKPVEVREYASGMRAAVLGPEFLVTVEAHRDADGNLVVRHTDPAEEHSVKPAEAELPTE
jgi:hypothetical protein